MHLETTMGQCDFVEECFKELLQCYNKGHLKKKTNACILGYAPLTVYKQILQLLETVILIQCGMILMYGESYM